MFGDDFWLTYDRQGRPIDMLEASVLLHDIDNRRVALTHLGGKRLEISTVFIPLAQPPWEPGKPPLIFETMVFLDGEPERTIRYATEDEALDGHNKLVEALRIRPDLIIEMLEAERAAEAKMFGDDDGGGSGI